MRILCDVCKSAKPVRRVSPDYEPSNHKTFIARAVSVAFVYKGESVDSFLLSPEFVRDEQIVPGDQALPENYPSWIHKVRAVCEDCFNRT